MIKITTHQIDALARLLEQYKGKYNWTAFVGAFGREYQETEDATYGLLNLTDIDLMTGNNLDLLGRIVGMPRNEVTNEEYRIFIKAKIGINTSQGTGEQVLAIFRILKGTNAGTMTEYFPACVFFQIEGSMISTLEENFISLMQQSVLGGVRVEAIKFSDNQPLQCTEVGMADPSGWPLSEVGTLDQGQLGEVL